MTSSLVTGAMTGYLIHLVPNVVRVNLKGQLLDVNAPGINDGDFHHIALVRHSSGLNQVYVDGVLKGTGSLPVGPLVIDQNGLWLGQEQDCVGGCFSASQAFTGVIDEVEIFNRALTAAEVRAIYDAGSAGKIKPAPAP